MLAQVLTFSPDCDESFFAEIPAAPAVFLLRGGGDPYISKTANLRRRLQRLLGRPAELSKRLNLRQRVCEIQFTPTGSDFESQFLLYKLLRKHFPTTYAARLRLRPAPLIKLHLENEYPRASVTTRLGKLAWKQSAWGQSPSAVRSSEARQSPDVQNLYYGPFPSRVAAEKFASDALDFFKMRRCVDDLHPEPSFPGCVYSEMKMCLAPCYKGCTDDEYRSEVARVQSFFDSGGESLTRELTEQREQASSRLAFEEAAAIHGKIEKLKHLLSQLPEIVQPLGSLQSVIVQPSPQPGSVSLFRFSNGVLQGPASFEVARSLVTINSANAADGERVAASALPKHVSMESRVQEAIQEISDQRAESAIESSEHLSILKRWYYRSHRIGEIFFADQRGTLPLRRIVRGIGRVYTGEKPEQSATFSETQPPVPPS
ncbi:MAG: UvrB/UvrC motif-containing protein [Terriglobales bacterium]